MNEGTEATSVATYLKLLAENGYFFTTTCNEADGGNTVFSIPLLSLETHPAISQEHLQTMKKYRQDALQMDIQNTVIDWIRKQSNNPLLQNREYPAYQASLRSFYSPSEDENPQFWFKSTSEIGSRTHGSLIARGPNRTLPIEFIRQRIDQLSVSLAYRFCYLAADAPVQDNIFTWILLGGLEKDKTTLSFVRIELIHT